MTRQSYRPDDILAAIYPHDRSTKLDDAGSPVLCWDTGKPKLVHEVVARRNGRRSCQSPFRPEMQRAAIRSSVERTAAKSTNRTVRYRGAIDA